MARDASHAVNRDGVNHHHVNHDGVNHEPPSTPSHTPGQTNTSAQQRVAHDPAAGRGGGGGGCTEIAVFRPPTENGGQHAHDAGHAVGAGGAGEGEGLMAREGLGGRYAADCEDCAEGLMNCRGAEREESKVLGSVNAILGRGDVEHGNRDMHAPGVHNVVRVRTGSGMCDVLHQPRAQGQTPNTPHTPAVCRVMHAQGCHS